MNARDSQQAISGDIAASLVEVVRTQFEISEVERLCNMFDAFRDDLEKSQLTQLVNFAQRVRDTSVGKDDALDTCMRLMKDANTVLEGFPLRGLPKAEPT